RQVGVDAALHADLGRACRPRLVDAVAGLLQRERVRVGVGATLSERAEAATGVTDVGEVDVPGDDVSDVVTDGFPPQAVGEACQRVQLGAVGVQQRECGVVRQPGR